MKDKMAKLIEITGKALSGEWGNDDNTGNGILVLRTTNFTNEGIVNYNNVVTRIIEKKKIEEKYLRKGDIIIEKSGGSDKQPVGRVVYFDGPENTYLFNNFTGLLRVKDQAKWYPRYVFYSLFSNYHRGGTRAFQNKTTGLHNLKIDDFVSLCEVTEAGINEQIAACKQMDRVNDIIRMHQQQLQKLDELVKARFVELFGMINEDVSLSYYIASLNAGKSLAGEEENPNKVLKTGAVTYDYFDATQIKNLPMDYEPQEGHRVKVGDVIISRMNTAELVGAAAYVWDVPEHIYLPDRLWRAEIKETANPIFVWQVLIQRSTKKSIRRIASGTSGSMKNISKPGLLGIRVVKAPIKLQEQFAAFVEQTDKSKVAVQKALDEAQLLFDSLMQKYFG